MQAAHAIAFESLGHTDLEWCAPLPPGQPDGWFAALETRPPRTVVDLGCGTGAFIRAWCAGNRGWTIGIDHSEQCIDTARQRSGGVGQWQVADAAQWARTHRNASDLTVCIGVEDLGGDWRSMLTLVDHVSRRGKWALIGVTVRDDSQPWAFIPELANHIPTEGALLNDVARMGWRIQCDDTASPALWQQHDAGWRQSIAMWLANNPDHPNAASFSERLRRGRQLFDALGPDALRFKTILARV